MVDTKKSYEYIYGVHPVEEALKSVSRDFTRLLISRDARNDRIASICSLARKKGIPVEFSERYTIEKLVKNNEHQGVCALVSRYQYSTEEEIIEAWAISGEKAFFLFLDSIEDPHNLGAITRTALLSGVHGIFIPAHRSAKVTPAVCKASSGAIEHLKVAVVKSLNSIITSLKKQDITVVGLFEEAEILLQELDCSRDIALVIGSEGRGIASFRERMCDYSVRIPASVQGISYNASVAAGIAMYEVLRQRKIS